MKLSNERILNDAATLRAVSNKQLPVKASYAIAKNINKIESELKIYHAERQKLIGKYSLKDKKGKPLVEDGNIKIADEYLEDWNKDIEELLAIENEVDVHKFDISLLEGFSMSPSELMLIDYMIEG